MKNAIVTGSSTGIWKSNDLFLSVGLSGTEVLVADAAIRKATELQREK